MIRSGHDQIERWLCPSVLGHKLKQVFVVDAPFLLLSMRNHLIAAVDFVESLLATELANSLPAQIPAIEKSRFVTELFEDRRGCGRQSLSHDWLKIDERACKRQTGNHYTEALDCADAGRNECLSANSTVAERFQMVGKMEARIFGLHCPRVVAFHHHDEDVRGFLCGIAGRVV